MDLKAAASKMRRLALSIKVNADGAVKEAAAEILANVVRDTPVDTGLAKSNWFVALDRRPFAYRFVPYAPGEKGSTAGANEAAAIAAGGAVIAAYDARKYNRVVIANYLPYIHRLNDGYSPQADPDYVQRAVFRARRKVNTLSLVSIRTRDDA